MALLETLKDAARLAQQLDNVELVKTILSLQRECYDLVFENRELREPLIKAKDALATHATLHFRRNAYWTGEGDSEDRGPYCSVCWDSKRTLMRMVRLTQGRARCHNCKHDVYLDGVPLVAPSYGLVSQVGYGHDL